MTFTLAIGIRNFGVLERLDWTGRDLMVSLSS